MVGLCVCWSLDRLSMPVQAGEAARSPTHTHWAVPPVTRLTRKGLMGPGAGNPLTLWQVGCRQSLSPCKDVLYSSL